MDTKHAESVDAVSLKDAATQLFNQEVHKRWAGAQNVWRTAWALDTILDYLRVCGVDGSAMGDDALHALNPTYKGNWWDDFGWIGIAALRAAEQQAFPKQGTAFLKIAINAWAYMHGEGWSRSSKAVYPFQDDALPGWSAFAKNHSTNFGAPRVWERIRKTWIGVTDEQVDQCEPRFSPGGIWNSPYTDDSQPHLSPEYGGWDAYLNPIQNTVTNGVYTVLSLRIYQAWKSGIHAEVFAESTLDPDACLSAWAQQIHWFNQWVFNAPAEQSLLYNLSNGGVIRERVSTFHTHAGKFYWDAAYRKDLAWTGDQGLLMGALREGSAAGYLNPRPPVLGEYLKILTGTYSFGLAQRTYGHVKGISLLPWMIIGYNGIPGSFPQGDDPDYQTGVGVFMRYLLQLYQAEPRQLQPFVANITASAKQLATLPLGAPDPAGPCDAFTPSGDDVDQLTAYINRLSVLVMGIALSG
jgi:hypothetical protein